MKFFSRAESGGTPGAGPVFIGLGMLLLNALGAAGAHAASLSFNPASVQLAPGETALVEIVASDVPASGLAAFQLDLLFDPAAIDVVDPNRAFTPSVHPYAPLGDNPFCATVRGGTCADSNWMITESGRTPFPNIGGDTGRVSILYGSSGSEAPSSGTGVIALIEVVGIANSSSGIQLDNAIIADNGNPPQAHPLTLGTFSVQVATNLVPTAVLRLLDASGIPIADGRVPYGAAFRLDGASSSDVDGTISQYRWSNPNLPAGTVTTTASELDITPALTGGPLPLGLHVFELQVVDDSGNVSTPAQVQVIVFDDQAPTAVARVLDAGGFVIADGRVPFGADFRLDGGNSSDAGGGTISQYRWSSLAFTDGTHTTDQAQFDVTPALTGGPLPLGQHIFELRVVDDSGNQSTPVQLLVTVIVSQPPVAAAGADYNMQLGLVAQLDGSASFDPDGGLLTFDWAFVGTPATSLLGNSNIVDRDQSTASFTPDVVGNYELELTVDNGVFQAADRIIVSVFVGNVPPVANAGDDFDSLLGQTILLDAGASFDPDNAPAALTYQWSLVSVPAGSSVLESDIQNGDQAAAQLVPDVEGIYVFGVDVSDGADADYDQVEVTVTQANLPPQANAGGDQTVLLGDVVYLSGSGSDPDNGPAALSSQWSFVALPAASLLDDTAIQAAATENASFVPDVVGEYLLGYEVFDGELSASDQVVITVEEQAGALPAAPENVIARAKRGRVTIVWDPVADAVQYRVYRRSSLETEFTQLIVTEGTVAGDVFALGETSIEYYVAAENGFGIGDPSVIVNVTPPTR